MTPSHRWDTRFLEVAQLIASWSKDPSTQVGAVAVRDRRILATGYNGMPAGVVDSPARLEDRSIKLMLTAHAETNLLTFAAREGISLGCSTVYVWPFPPCSHCAGQLINAGVLRVVVPELPIPDRWTQSFEWALQMFDEAGVELHRLRALSVVK